MSGLWTEWATKALRKMDERERDGAIPASEIVAAADARESLEQVVTQGDEPYYTLKIYVNLHLEK